MVLTLMVDIFLLHLILLTLVFTRYADDVLVVNYGSDITGLNVLTLQVYWF